MFANVGGEGTKRVKAMCLPSSDEQYARRLGRVIALAVSPAVEPLRFQLGFAFGI